MDRTITLTVKDNVGTEFKLETLKQLEQFAVNEHAFWQSKTESLSGYTGNVGHYLNAANYFQQIITHITNFKSSLKTWDDATLQGQIDQHISNNVIRNLTPHWLWSGHPFVDEWLNVADKYGNNAANAFIEAFISNRQFSNLNNIEYLKGAVLAYEFELQDESTLTKRRNSERASISKVRSDLIDAKDTLFNDVHEFQTDFHEWDENTRAQAQRLYEAHAKLGERRANRHTRSFDHQMDEWHQNIENLEHTYKEKLRLEKPAEYWRTKARSYFKQGAFWSSLLGLALGGGIYGFGQFFSQWLQAQQLQVELDSLQGIVLFVTTLSIYAFTIKTVSRLAFSSFHLQRDAEEREQLTHVYLALTHEKDELDTEARNIVLQALFSRADTGLLSGDSGPTMPGLHEIVRATTSR
ncbi:hypothetical protein LCGC14_0896740 [marine sediment metagenome]|uniref:DUF6161 domain-containing protein n=1 Tax=marine sediment metagenome TaxID=412755 RepID=A0A0F9PIE2_9ZZZZ